MQPALATIICALAISPKVLSIHSGALHEFRLFRVLRRRRRRAAFSTFGKEEGKS